MQRTFTSHDEDAIRILARACNDVPRNDLDSVGSLLDAIGYLRTGRYIQLRARGSVAKMDPEK